MGVNSFRQILDQYRLLVLDTMVFSYHFAHHPRYGPLTRVVLDTVESGQAEGLMTTITLAEVLTRPAQAGDKRAMYDYELFLSHFPHLRLVPLDADLARETARVRAYTRLRTPDAVQVAAARLYGADVLITNDHRWQERVRHPALILLDDYVSDP
jgi:predicted nucleic acid-binding protein